MCHVLGVGILNGPCALLPSIALITLLKDVVSKEYAVNYLDKVVDWRDLVTDHLVHLAIEFFL